MTKICPPALIFIVFSLTQIIIDLVKGLYNTAVMKFIIMAIIGFLLNVLCQGGLGIISWIIVFIPFVLMTIIAAMLLYAFGLKDTTGTIVKTSSPTNTNTDAIVTPPTIPTPQPVDSRCFTLQTSSFPQHGMKNVVTSDVYCP